MRKHEVTFEVPQRPLGRADAKFLVKTDGAVLGTLAISNGSVVWFRKGTSYGLKMSWPEFDEAMEEQAKRVERR
jgi:hypothetical protein